MCVVGSKSAQRLQQLRQAGGQNSTLLLTYYIMLTSFQIEDAKGGWNQYLCMPATQQLLPLLSDAVAVPAAVSENSNSVVTSFDVENDLHPSGNETVMKWW